MSTWYGILAWGPIMVPRPFARSIYHGHFTREHNTEVKSYNPLVTMESIPAEKLQKLLQGPAGIPPPGVKPNLVNPPNQRISGQAAILVCGIVASIALFMRIYTRIFVIRKTNMSDCKIVPKHTVSAANLIP